MIKYYKSSWNLSEEPSDTESIYSSTDRSQLLEDDEISTWEAAFMEGWDDSVV